MLTVNANLNSIKTLEIKSIECKLCVLIRICLTESFQGEVDGSTLMLLAADIQNFENTKFHFSKMLDIALNLIIASHACGG